MLLLFPAKDRLGYKRVACAQMIERCCSGGPAFCTGAARALHLEPLTPPPSKAPAGPNGPRRSSRSACRFWLADRASSPGVLWPARFFICGALFRAEPRGGAQVGPCGESTGCEGSDQSCRLLYTEEARRWLGKARRVPGPVPADGGSSSGRKGVRVA